jgi:DNA-binding response OmpR family regulator
MRVLVVEDSRILRESLRTALKKSGYAVDATGDGAEGLWFAEEHAYDAIVLDLMLPGRDGLSILGTLRRDGNAAQILILTAKDTVEDRVRGLKAGADDYLVKPFALAELLARVQALCRRRYAEKRPVLKIGDLEIDTAAKLARRAGHALVLTPREFRLLEYLAMRGGAVATRQEIWTHIYNDDAEPASNAVDSAICVLRRKIDSPGLAPLVHTRRGEGYFLGGNKP